MLQPIYPNSHSYNKCLSKGDFSVLHHYDKFNNFDTALRFLKFIPDYINHNAPKSTECHNIFSETNDRKIEETSIENKGISHGHEYETIKFAIKYFNRQLAKNFDTKPSPTTLPIENNTNNLNQNISLTQPKHS